MTQRHGRPAASGLRASCLAALIALASIGLAYGATLEEILRPPHVPGEVLVKFNPGAPAPARASLRQQLDARTLKTFHSGGECWRLGSGHTEGEALALLRGSGLIAYAEPNYVLSISRTPNDPRYGELYGLHNVGQNGGVPGADIDAERAWNVSTGSPSVVVAVIDTGVDYTHPDLAANIWTNPGEIPGNGIDDDGDGFVDDVHGYDFYNHDGDPMDDNSHGTHVSGTIAGIGDNGIGVAGVTWSVKILPVKFLSGDGYGSTDDAVSAIEYATDRHVDIMSNSWGGGGFSQALLDAINAASDAGILFVAAAGNASTNIDVSPFYPASYAAPNLVAVAATDRYDNLAYFSNFGVSSVHLGAPGVDTLSCVPGGGYDLKSGTSMATPHVSGVAALIKSVAPGMDLAHLKARLLSSTVPIPSLAGRTVTGGRVNAFLAVADPDTTPPGDVTDLSVTQATSNSLILSWTAPGDDGATGRATSYEIRRSDAPIDASNFALATLVPGAPPPAAGGQPESLEIGGLPADHVTYVALITKDEWGNASGISNVASGRTLPPPTFASSPASFDFALLTGGTASAVLTIQNVGVGTLDWTVDDPLRGNPPPPPDYGDSPAKGEADPRVGPPAVTGAGGPDAFGYRYVDSDAAGGPAFVWNDISSTGTPISSLTGDAQVSEPIPLGFSFPFYGSSFDSVRVSTDGWLSFTNADPHPVNQPLPSGAAPEYLIAPFWDDLYFGGIKASYAQDGESFTVQYTSVTSYYYGGSFTFQVTLHAAGSIEFRYKSMTGATNAATVGIQDGSRTVGLQIVFNNSYVRDGLAVRIEPLAAWLAVAPRSGRVSAGASAPVTLSVDASGLDGGVYTSAVVVHTNDPAHPAVSHPVTLTVTGAPDIRVSGAEQTVTSTATYSTSGAPTDHHLVTPIPPVGAGTLELTADGDYGDPPETATAIAEGRTLGFAGSTGIDCSPAHAVFGIAAADLAAMTADGSVDVHVQNSSAVDAFCVENRHTVTLRYHGPADALDFGSLFIGVSRTLSVTIENRGSATLEVTQITTGADVFVASASALSIPAHGSSPLTVTFTPQAEGSYSGVLRLSSNDADSPEVTLPLSGTGLVPPAIDVSPTSLSSTLDEGHEDSQPLTIANRGGSPLRFTILVSPATPTIRSTFQGLGETAPTAVNVPAGGGSPPPSSPPAPAGSYRAATGEFQSLQPSPFPLTCIVTDNAGYVYAQANGGYAFVRYAAATNAWETLSASPVYSGNNGGAALLNGRIYTVYTGSSQMGIYDIGANSWSVAPNPLGRGTGNIASDGVGLLYLMDGSQAIRYDPVTQTVESLATPPIYFYSWGGLQLVNGTLYGVSGDGTRGFVSYDVAAGSWTVLPQVPGGAVLGTAYDPFAGDFYAYGTYAGNTLYRYSIADGAWSALTIPTFFVNDGGLAYLSGPVPGVLIAEGEGGRGFARYVTGTSGVSVSPASGSVEAGGTATIDVLFDARSTPPGTYAGVLHVDSNDPVTPRADVTTSFTIIGHPRIQVDPATLDFGAPFIGARVARTLTIENPGSIALEVSNIAADQTDFAASASSLTVPPHGTRSITVTYAPSSPGVAAATLMITSNAADTPVVSVSLSGAGRIAPIIGVAPPALSSTLDEGNRDTRTLTISNTGGNDLAWQLTLEPTGAHTVVMIPPPPPPGPVPVTSDAAPAGFASAESMPVKTPGAEVLLVEDVLPWGSDADALLLAANGIAYDRIFSSALPGTDLTAYPLVIIAGDQYSSTYATLLGQSQHLADFVLGGGVLEFHAAAWGWNSGDASGLPLPGGAKIAQRFAAVNHVADPSHPIVAGVPEPFTGTQASHAYFTGIPAGSRTIATDDVGHPDLIEYGYGAGLVIASGQPLEYYYANAGPVRQILLNIIPYAKAQAHSWILVDSVSGTVPAGSASNVTVTFDAGRTGPGTHTVNVRIDSDDPLTPVVRVPASLTVIGHPNIDVDPTAIDFGSVFVTGRLDRTLVIRNKGSVALTVSSIKSDAPEFAASPAALSVPPHDSRSVTVTFAPTDAVPSTSTLHVASDDPDTPVADVALSGTGLPAPVIGVSPSSMTSTLDEGHVETQPLTIVNTGGSPLTFSIVPLAGTATIHSEFAGLDAQDAGARNDPPRATTGPLPAPPAPADAPGFTALPGDFQLLQPSPTYLTCVVGDGSRYLYAQANGGYAFYRYDAQADSWATLAQSPLYSGNNGGAALLNGRIYTSYTGSSTLGVYDIASNTWSTIASPLVGTANIASDGTQLLYLVLNTSAVSFDPATGTAVSLPRPPISFQPWGGLQWRGGVLYGHEGNGYQGFASFDIAAQSWATLPSIPSGAVLGSAIDPVTGDYFAYGSYSGHSLYRYAIAQNAWSVMTIPTFAVNDGGMAYFPGPTPGIVFVQGESGTGLARFVTGSAGITVTPTSGTVSPGGTAGIDVRFDARTTPPGTYDGRLHVTSNDPLRPVVDVTTRFTIVGHPRIALDPTAVDFGSIFVGASAERAILVKNIGSATLHVSSLTADDPSFVPLATALDVPPHSSLSLGIAFRPVTAGAHPATLSVTSDDSDSPVVAAALTGIGLVPPRVGVSPPALSVVAYPGQIVTRTVTVANTGGSDLTWTAHAHPVAAPSAASVDTLVVQDADPWYSTADQQVLNAAGISYEVVSSAALGWLDLSAYKLVLVPSDQYSFTYATLATYASKLALYVANGGTLEFHAAGSGYHSGNSTVVPLPGGVQISQRFSTLNHVVTSPHPITDGLPASIPGTYASHVYFTGIPASATTLVADEANGPTTVYYAYGAGHVLASGNTLEYYYSNLGSPIRTLLTNMIPYAYENATTWIRVEPQSGTVVPGGSAALTVTFDATRLSPGDFGATVTVASNDPISPEVVTPASLHVQGLPDIDLGSARLDFGKVFVGYPQSLPLRIANVGTETLHVSSIGTGDPDVTVDASALDVPAHDARQVLVSVHPGAPRTIALSLGIDSDDPDEGHVDVAVTATALLPPRVAIAPATIEATAIAGRGALQNLRIDNTGGSDLDWSLDQPGDAGGRVVAQVTPPPPGPAGSERALLLEDDEPFFTSAIEQILLANHIPYDIKGSGDLPTLDLGAYKLVVVAGDQGYWFYGVLADQAARLAGYVASGGVLEFHADAWAWHQGDPSNIVLPGGVLIQRYFSTLNLVTDRSHPIVSGVPESFVGQNASHANFIAVPEGTDVIARDDSGGITLAEYRYGSGTVIAASQTLEYAYEYTGGPIATILSNMIPYAFGLAPDWLTFHPKIGQLHVGQGVDVTFEMDSTGTLEPGTYTQTVSLATNDPDRLSTPIDVRFHVLQLRADAGPDKQLECTGAGGASVVLDGSASDDRGGPGAITSYLWTESGVSVGTGQTISVHLPVGVHDVTLRIEDTDGASDEDEARVSVIDSTPPHGTITFPAPNACYGPTALPITVRDSYVEVCDGAVVRTYDPPSGPVVSSHGDHAVRLTASDPRGNTAPPAQVSFTIDTVPPVVAIVADLAHFQLPDLIPFSNFYAASDDDGASGGVVHETVAVDGCVAFDGLTYGDGDGLLSDETISPTETTLCQIARACGTRRWTDPVVSVTATDCGGNASTVSRTVKGDYLASACKVVDGLTVAKSGGATRLTWAPVAGSASYQAVRGDLAALRANRGAYEAAIRLCLGNGIAGTSVDDVSSLAPGASTFYLVRDVTDGVKGSWDEPVTSLVASRDGGVDGSGAACP